LTKILEATGATDPPALMTFSCAETEMKQPEILNDFVISPSPRILTAGGDWRRVI